VTRHHGQRSTGGGRSSYRHPVENAEFDRALREASERKEARKARLEARKRQVQARREQERREGKIP